MVQILLGFLIILLAYYAFFWLKDLLLHKADLKKGNIVTSGLIGLVADFLDTLGIGSFAITVVLLNATKSLKNERLLPGTLNVGHTIPILVEAFIFTATVKVAPLTLFSLVISAVIGAVIGAKIVKKLPNQKVQLTMGVALFLTTILMTLKQLKMLELLGQGNKAIGLTGCALLVAIFVNFILGALMTAGVGLYAPCMAMVYMLGLSPIVVFPIMMASCAGLMPVASVEFIKVQDYSRTTSVGIAIGGSIGVIIATTLVKSLPLTVLTWIIIVIVLYTSITYLKKGLLK
ncbi:MAG: sulfite exporter TauE/SafE family protein [Lactobacillales bacterium]|nr:sulfite exporter TauE/SafE family protein [Lactobacillales bacterium]